MKQIPFSSKFTLTAAMSVVLSNCGSALSDTYMYLFNAGGSLITSNDDYSGAGACSNTYHSRIAQTLSAGTYYVVSEGYSANGNITTNISGTLAANSTTGNTLQNPILAGSFGSAFSWSNTVNTSSFTSTFGRPTNDVFYRFTLSAQMDITVTHCGSTLSDTYLYLLDASGNTIDYNDDYYGTGACSNTYHSILKKTLSAGTYYAVSEGYGSNGSITTNITGTLVANNTVGNTFQNPIIMGSYSASFDYSNSQNTANFTNAYGQSSSDVFYKFTLSASMTVTISHCNSTLSDTYLHLLDANGTRIAYNDDYSGACSNYYHSCLTRNLGTGTYYIVSEGYSANGVIVTAVSGELPPPITYSYDASGNRTSRMATASVAFAPANELRSSVIKDRTDGSIFDPGRDGSKDEAKTVENRIEIDPEAPSQPTVTVYPNPTDGLLTVSIAGYREGTQAEIRLYNSAGKILHSRKAASDTETIDLSAYAQGLYMAVISVDGENETHKIIRK